MWLTFFWPRCLSERSYNLLCGIFPRFSQIFTINPLDWIRLDHKSSNRIRLDQIGSDWIRLNQIRSDWKSWEMLGRLLHISQNIYNVLMLILFISWSLWFSLFSQVVSGALLMENRIYKTEEVSKNCLWKSNVESFEKQLFQLPVEDCAVHCNITLQTRSL